MTLFPSGPPPLPVSLLGCFEDRVVSQDLAELVEAMLHLGNAGQLGLQPLFLLGEREARRRVQLLKAPASLAVELEQVGVVLPEGGEEGFKVGLKSERDQRVSFSSFTFLNPGCT